MILGLATSLFRMFRENSNVVPVSRLQKEGVKSVTVLDWDRVQKLIGRAVEETLARRGVELSPEALASVSQEAREAFHRLVAQRDNLEEAARTLEQEKAALRDNLMQLHAELESSRTRLASERGREVKRDDVALSAQGLDSLSERLQASIREILASSPADSAELGERLAAAARGIVDAERDHALEDARLEQRQRIELLERRIAKLQRTLTDTEQVVEHLKQAKSVDTGVESIYRTVQGLDSADAKAGEKRGLLEQVFQLNLELRGVIDDSGAAGKR